MHFTSNVHHSENLYLEGKSVKGLSAISMWWKRWFLSSNAKDIGTLYLIFALFSGLLGTAFSVLIRLELSGPGVQYIADNQLYNAVITAHAILMIFFMVMPAILGGLGNFLLPILAEGEYIAFPRLNNISFWLLPPSLILFLFAATIENWAVTGWTLYPFLSGIRSHSVNLTLFALFLSGISSLLVILNFMATLCSIPRSIKTRNIKFLLSLFFIIFISLYLDFKLISGIFKHNDLLVYIIPAFLASLGYVIYKLMKSEYEPRKNFLDHMYNFLSLLYNNFYLTAPIIIGCIILSYLFKTTFFSFLGFNANISFFTYVLGLLSIWLPLTYIIGIFTQVYVYAYLFFPCLNLNIMLSIKMDFSLNFVNNNITFENLKRILVYIYIFKFIMGVVGLALLDLFDMNKIVIFNLSDVNRSPSPNNNVQIGLGVYNNAIHREAPLPNEIATGQNQAVPVQNPNLEQGLQANNNNLPPLNDRLRTSFNAATGESTGATILGNRADLATNENTYRTSSNTTNSNYFILPESSKSNMWEINPFSMKILDPAERIRIGEKFGQEFLLNGQPNYMLSTVSHSDWVVIVKHFNIYYPQSPTTLSLPGNCSNQLLHRSVFETILHDLQHNRNFFTIRNT